MAIRGTSAWPTGNGEMATRIRALDWSETPLGPLASWPTSVRVAADLALASPVPAVLLWGPVHTQIYNDRWRDLVGARHPAALGRPALECFPETAGTMISVYEQVLHGEAVILHDTPHPVDRDGDIRDAWWNVHCLPVRDEDAAVAGILCTFIDTTAAVLAQRERETAAAILHDSERHLRMLAAEFQHRVRNILTVVRSVFSRSVAAGGSTGELDDHFRGRLDALIRTQVALTRTMWRTVDLENLIRDELLSVGSSDGPRLSISGPDVGISAKAAESIGLAIHELTTNSIKYGALGASDGRLDICWVIKLDYGGGRRLVLTWTEQGVPAVSVEPTRYGFGRELIEEALPYRLGAETRIEFMGGGMRCTVSLPLPDERRAAAAVERQ